MKTVFCDLCGQQLTEAEVDGMARFPSEHGELRFYVAAPFLDGRKCDVCWRCVGERLLAVAPPRQPR
ncbi:MAG TPA: hypothetical protein VHN13_18540 [Candidatus Tectomicrobia bacterium]|nr:hypothetical protein [Candidatus Tectomicrobia bacterium]